jgi:hypothetical protein
MKGLSCEEHLVDGEHTRCRVAGRVGRWIGFGTHPEVRRHETHGC